MVLFFIIELGEGCEQLATVDLEIDRPLMRKSRERVVLITSAPCRQQPYVNEFANVDRSWRPLEMHSPRFKVTE